MPKGHTIKIFPPDIISDTDATSWLVSWDFDVFKELNPQVCPYCHLDISWKNAKQIMKEQGYEYYPSIYAGVLAEAEQKEEREGEKKNEQQKR